MPDDFAGVLGTGAAGGFAREDDGGRFRVDEFGDASDVDFVGDLLFGFTVSEVDTAGGAGAAVDCGDRCDSGKHAAGDEPGAAAGSGGDFAGVDGGAVCGVALDFQVAVMGWSVEVGGWWLFKMNGVDSCRERARERANRSMG